jgi:exonuclease SbcD
VSTTIIHISDTHFGEDGFSLKDDLDVFRRLISHAQEDEANAIIHTGDLFHRPDPPNEVVDEVVQALQPRERYVGGWDDYYIPFYYIRGTYGHDIGTQTGTPGLNGLANIEGVEMMYPPVARSVGADHEVALFGIPAHMNPHFENGADSIDELSFGLHKNCEYVIACVHLTLSDVNTGGYLWNRTQYPSSDVLGAINPHRGPDAESVDVDLLACGDLHSYRRERTLSSGDTRIVYAGSLTGRYSAGTQKYHGMKYRIECGTCEMTKLTAA